MSARIKLLLIGPLPIAGDVVGGTKVSFAQLVQALADDERFALEVHDISRRLRGRGRLGRWLANARGLAGLLARLLRRGGHYDVVMFNTSAGGALSSGPLVRAACKLHGLPLAVRVFGGDLDLALERAGGLSRALARSSWLRAELLLVQTRGLARALPADSSTRWWPTTRDLEGGAPRRGRARRFLFLGQLRPQKGVAEALAASDELPEGASLTLHGPAMPGFDPALFARHARAEYRGPLEPAEVPAVLARHDVLVFPSYHEGEGLPGVVIEALQAGLPVIAADWRALPELIRDGENGRLVAPRSAEQLAAAMRALASDDELFARLSRAARASGELYRAAPWNARLADWLHELSGSATEARLAREPAPDDLHEEAA